MSYYIDLEKISIDDYKSILRSTNFLPSWEILKDNIDGNLDVIKSHAISNLDELHNAIKFKKKVPAFAQQCNLSENYLNVLRRVINGYRPKPNRIQDFPNVNIQTVEKLEALGIKNTLHLFEKVLSATSRKVLAQESGIHKKEILTLTKLADLSRVKWVNHTFANVLLLAGYDTAEKVANANPEELYETVKKLNAEKKLFPAHIGLNDMKRVIDSAKTLTFDIQYE